MAAVATNSTGSRRRGAARTGTARATAAPRRRAQQDALTQLIADHRAVDQLFDRYERLGASASAVERRRLVSVIGEMLAVHAGIEETVLYPVARTALGEGRDASVIESLEEHHLVKVTLAELERTPVDSERFDAKVQILIANVRHHVAEEEGELFPVLRRRLDRDRMHRLGELLEDARAMVPHRPHPHAPDTPPGNLIAAVLSAPLDLVVLGLRKVLRRG